MDESLPGSKNWAIVMIHGVGDTDPGQLITAVRKPLEDTIGLVLDQENQLNVIEEKLDYDKGFNRFPVFMQRGQAGQDRVLLAEVHWADLTRIGSGPHLLLAAIVRCIYGIRHIALQAAIIPGKLGLVLHATLRWVIFLLQGPVYALFIFEAILCILYLLLIPERWDRPEFPRGPVLLVMTMLTVGLALFCGHRWLVLRKRHVRAVLWPSLLLTTTITLIHIVLRFVTIADDLYQKRIIPHLNVLESQSIGEIPLLVFIIDEVLDRLFATVGIGVVLGGFAVTIAALVSDRSSFRSMWSAWLATLLLVTLWHIVSEPIDLIAQWTYDRSRQTVGALYTVWFNEACLAGLGPALAITGLLVVIRQVRWSMASDTNSGSSPPRLIIGAPIQICLIVFACILFPMVIIDGLHIKVLRFGSIAYGWVYLIYLPALAVVLGGSLMFRNTLHIMADIIGHFHSPGSDGLYPRSRYTSLRYPMRRRIAKRLQAVLERLVLPEKPTHLVILAHSQGTIIALEELRKRRWSRHFSSLQTVTLVTLGSPFTHIYQNYFPLLYGDLSCGRWKWLHHNISTWFNVYRSDDFVGTRILSSDGLWPQNIELSAGLWLRGHTRYWEHEVFHTIRQLLPNSIGNSLRE